NVEPAPVSGVMGTTQYMAPEQFASKADVRTDVWGLGATLYELLTLRRAFDGESTEEVCKRIISAPPPPPRALVGNVPADLEAVCLKALSKKPPERYATAHEFAEDLRRWLEHWPTKALPGRLWFRLLWLWIRRNPGWATAATLLTLSLIAAALL